MARPRPDPTASQPRRDPIRRSAPPALLAAVVAVVVGVTGIAPAAAFSQAVWPVQSVGDRGSDVATIQSLLRQHLLPAPPPVTGRARVWGINPVVPTVDGLYGETTRIAVRSFQFRSGLAQSGIVDAPTWTRLVVPIGPGATGEAVAALQRLLREKLAATTVPIDGLYGAATVAAVKAFQAHAGLAQTGSMDVTSWRNLAWHFELPRFSSSALCDFSVGNGPANWGTAEMTAVLEAVGAAMVGAGYGRVAIGDVGFEHGGDIPGHITHEVGLDADIRPMRKANDQCSSPSRWHLTTYDREATRALILAIRAAAPGHLKVILFNDPVLIAEGLTVYRSAHDDHLHVRLCEAGHLDPRYRC